MRAKAAKGSKKAGKKKKKRGLPPCPGTLKKAMALINKVPLDQEWPNFETVLREAGGDHERALEVLRARVPGLPYTQWRNLKPGMASAAYIDLFTTRRIMLDITNGKDAVRRGLEYGDFAFADWPKVEAQMRIDARTFCITLRPLNARAIEAFVGVDVRYIRACVRCGRIFWPKREVSVTCSTRCGNWKRKQVQRERWPLLQAEDAVRIVRAQQRKEAEARRIAFVESITRSAEGEKKAADKSANTNSKKGRK